MTDPEAAYQKYLRYRDEFRALDAKYRKARSGKWETPAKQALSRKLESVRSVKEDVSQRYYALLEYFDTLSEVRVDSSTGAISLVSPQGFSQEQFEAHVKDDVVEAKRLQGQLRKIEIEEKRLLHSLKQEQKKDEDWGARLSQVERLLDEAWEKANK